MERTRVKKEDVVNQNPPEEIKKEVVEEVKVELPPWWQKVGGGSFRMGGKIIKPNQKFRAWPNEIPKAFRDLVKPLGGVVTWDDPKVKGDKPIMGKKPEYVLVPDGNSKTLFNIVNKEGKNLNEKPLERVVAEKLLEDLAK